MGRVVRVRDHSRLSDSEVFLQLEELLPFFEPDGHAWVWTLQRQPELILGSGWDFNVAALERDIAVDARGLQMPFEDLQRFATRVDQVVLGEFLAAVSPAELPNASASGARVGASAIAGLAAIDSSFWIVGGPHDIIEAIARDYEDIEELSPLDWDRAED